MEDFAEIICGTFFGILGGIYCISKTLPYMLAYLFIIFILFIAYGRFTLYASPATWIVTVCLLCNLNLSSISNNSNLIMMIILFEFLFLASTYLKFALSSVIYMSGTVISLYISAFIVSFFEQHISPKAACIWFTVIFAISSLCIIMHVWEMSEHKTYKVLKGTMANIIGIFCALIVFFFANMPIIYEEFSFFKNYEEMGIIKCLHYIIPISVIVSIIETIIIVLPSINNYYYLKKRGLLQYTRYNHKKCKR